MKFRQYQIERVELAVAVKKYQQDRRQQSDGSAATGEPEIRAARKEPYLLLRLLKCHDCCRIKMCGIRKKHHGRSFALKPEKLTLTVDPQQFKAAAPTASSGRYGQHRTGCAADDLLSDAAARRIDETVSSLGGHDDQIGFLANIEDRLYHVAFAAPFLPNACRTLGAR